MYGATALYTNLSQKLVSACIVSVTASQKRNAGKPIKDLRFANSVPAIVRDIASQVSVADADSCRPVGDLPVSRIVDRTSRYLQAITRDAAADRQIADLTGRVQHFLRSHRVHHNLIPADPADFSSGEGALSQIGNFLIPTSVAHPSTSRSGSITICAKDISARPCRCRISPSPRV